MNRIHACLAGAMTALALAPAGVATSNAIARPDPVTHTQQGALGQEAGLQLRGRQDNEPPGTHLGRAVKLSPTKLTRQEARLTRAVSGPTLDRSASRPLRTGPVRRCRLAPPGPSRGCTGPGTSLASRPR